MVLGRSHELDGTHVGGTGQRCQSKQMVRGRPNANFAALELFTRNRSLIVCEPIPMRKPLTGEPCAGEPHARFGGRGEWELFPTPIKKHHRRPRGGFSRLQGWPTSTNNDEGAFMIRGGGAQFLSRFFHPATVLAGRRTRPSWECCGWPGRCCDLRAGSGPQGFPPAPGWVSLTMLNTCCCGWPCASAAPTRRTGHYVVDVGQASR